MQIWQEPEFRTCQFCGCYSNALVRACCRKGIEDDARLRKIEAERESKIRDEAFKLGGAVAIGLIGMAESIRQRKLIDHKCNDELMKLAFLEWQKQFFIYYTS